MITFASTPGWLVDSIGSTAAFCTTLSFVPQLVRVWQRKSARDISLAMFLLFSFGEACWLIYGLDISSTPVIAANAVTLALALAILGLKLHYGRHEVVGEKVNDRIEP
ncbi:MAG TPA: SemiSWEET transporter [Terracidiphilus sp.]|nr:SemiSWEET transporter [Terracidiphilus sp.]